MVISWTQPRLSRSDRLFQLSYELPHRVHVARVYPVRSPNGSAVIVYGHANGLRILWRGGRPFQAPAETASSQPETSNGAGSDVIMIIDSDEDEPGKGASAPPVEEGFEAEELMDPCAPFPPIIQYLDLPLGTEVLQLSFPPVPPEAAHTSHSSVPLMMAHKLFMVAACSDQTVRLISLPLTPPSHGLKASRERAGSTTAAKHGLGRWDEQVVMLGSSTALQDVPRGVDLTVTPRESTLVDEGDGDDEDAGMEDRHTTRARSRQRSTDTDPINGDQEWDLLVAAHSPEVSGMLFIFRAPIVAVSSPTDASTKNYVIAVDHVVAIDIHTLSSPASSLCFNPSRHQRRHSQLLVVGTKGDVRVFECVPPPSRGSRASSRRSSLMDPGKSERGSWLITLYPAFDREHRKRILDAKWVLGGKGILALLADGEWGVWDIEGGAPGHNGSQRDGLHGSAKTAWNLSGWVEDSSSKGKRDGASTPTDFAPRTPYSRRREERRWFAGVAPSGSGYAQGGIAVRPLPGRKGEPSADEAIVMWRDGCIVMTPSLRAYWETQVTRRRNGGSLYSADGRDRLTKMEGIRLGGEMVTTADIFPSRDDSPTSRASRALPEVLVVGEHRLLIVVTPANADPDQAVRPDGPLPQTLPLALPSTASSQQLVPLRGEGDLALTGIEDALAEMDRGRLLLPSSTRQPHGGSMRMSLEPSVVGKEGSERRVGFLASAAS
ncbi:MAG: hypothetical protein M1838_002255 [Thelocarpon superellum]|nr:MAG: hypothetical protein M1838_002255 [Thelocarpon superellum]